MPNLDDPCGQLILSFMPRTYGPGWTATASGSKPLAEYLAMASKLSPRELRAGLNDIMKRPGVIPPSPATIYHASKAASLRKPPASLELGQRTVETLKTQLKDRDS